MKIADTKVIVCCPGRNFVTLKITTEDGVPLGKYHGLKTLGDAVGFKLPTQQAGQINIKKDFYRPIQLVVKGLALFNNVTATNTTERIKQLANSGIIPNGLATELGNAVDQIGAIRLRAHLFYGEQNDTIYTQQPGGQVAGPAFVLAPQEVADLFLLVITALDPLQQFGAQKLAEMKRMVG